MWQVSLVRQRTLTRPEHPVMPFLHSALMFERSTCYAIFTDFGSFIDYSIGQRIGIWSYWFILIITVARDIWRFWPRQHFAVLYYDHYNALFWYAKNILDCFLAKIKTIAHGFAFVLIQHTLKADFATLNEWFFEGMKVCWLVVFNVPSTARSYRDGTPI